MNFEKKNRQLESERQHLETECVRNPWKMLYGVLGSAVGKSTDIGDGSL